MSIHFPEDFFTDKIGGEACGKYYDPKLFDADLKYVAQLKIQDDSKLKNASTSLTVVHDYISRRWQKLLDITYGTVAIDDSTAARQVAEVLVDLASIPN